jgi:ABC-type branched-subunit amino acid transport system permease subunit
LLVALYCAGVVGVVAAGAVTAAGGDHQAGLSQLPVSGSGRPKPVMNSVLQNTATAHVHFLFWSADVALAGAILLAAALGALVGFLIAFVRQLQFRRAMRREHQTHTSAAPPPAHPAP